MPAETKFPTEVVDLPSQGLVYPEKSPLSSGKLEIKYMTAKEEDILTSQNLIQKGVVLDHLLDALIIDKAIKVDDLVLGDKNAVMIAARILAYGPEYTVEITDPTTGDQTPHTFDLTKCDFKELPEDLDYSKGEFSFQLPVSKNTITFKLLTGNEEKQIDRDVKASKKVGTSAEITTRLRHMITSVDGNTDAATISNYANNMLSKDSLELRKEVLRITPDIEMSQEIEIGGETVEVDIPLTVEFFWPSTDG